MLEKRLGCQMEFLLMERDLIDIILHLCQMVLIMKPLTLTQVNF